MEMSVRALICALALGFVVYACGDGADVVPGGGGPVEGDGDGDGDGDIDVEPEMVQDRCLTAACQPVALPEQPKLAFLEDMGEGWQRLMEADWQLAAGSEGYRCQTLTIPEDVYIVAFNPISPTGTHHATFGISSEANEPDQVVKCGVGAGGERRLHGSGAGSEMIEMREGVAMPLRKGEQVLMNLHLFNPSEATISGRSGMWVMTIPADQVEHEAEAVLAGPLTLTIPPGRSVQTGGCTIRSDVTLYGVGPHLHQLGVHVRVTADTAGSTVEVYEGDYDFLEQRFYHVDPLALKAGDRVNVECMYDNDTARTVSWGDSSLDEMCFASMGIYPAGGYGGIPCFD